MRALLDVNVLIALFDPNHAFHQRAHSWWALNAGAGWASCPITENGVVRILSNPNYSGSKQFAPVDLLVLLRGFADQTDHKFWPDDISLLDQKLFAENLILSSRKLTDYYLLGLATINDGCLITFDQGISLTAVLPATPSNLCVL